MNWNFDSLFFLGFGLLCCGLGLSRSQWLFWGVKKFEKLEAVLGKNYKQITNITVGLICIAIAVYFLLR